MNSEFESQIVNVENFFIFGTWICALECEIYIMLSLQKYAKNILAVS